MSLATPKCLYESVVYQDNPTGWWGLDEASATADDSGNGRTLSAVGTPANSAPLLTFDAGGTADGARDFNGSTQSYTAASLTVDSAIRFTIEFWAQFDTVSGTQTIMSFGANTPNVRRNGTEIEITNGTTQFQISSGAALAINTPYHIVIVATHDDFTLAVAGSSGTTAPFSIYVDGVAKSLGAGGAGVPSSTTWTPRIGSKTGGSEWFDGKLDEVAVYRYGLTQHQVSQHYNAGKNGTWGTQFLGTTGTGKYPRFALEVAFDETYQYQGLNQRFLDASDLLRNLTFFRGGSNAALDPPRAGTMSFDLSNAAGEFEDKSSARFWHTSALARNYAEPGRAVRFRMWWPDNSTPVYSMFYGYVESMTFRRRPGDAEPFVGFTATDILLFLSQAKGNGASHADEGSDERIASILESPTFPFGGSSSIDIPKDFENGAVTMDFHVSEGGVLDLINQVTFTEGGGSVFIAGKDGRLKFFNNTHRSGGSSTTTYGPSDLPFKAADPVHDTSSVFTIVAWENTDTVFDTLQEDDDYKLKFGDRVHTKVTLHSTSGILDAAALAFLNRYKNSSKRIPTIYPVPQAYATPATSWAEWMAHEISDKITVVDTADGGLGTSSLTLFIEGIGMQLSPGQIECSLNVSPYS